MLEKFDDALNANDDTLLFDEDFSKATSFANRVDLDKINLDDDNDFDVDNPETIIHVRLLAWGHKFEKRKALEKKVDEKLMPLSWHLIRW